MKLDVYINYNGTCEQAFSFYEQHLGGKIIMITRHGDNPAPNSNIAKDWHDKILHAQIEIGATTLMGADIPNAEPMRSAYLTITVTEEAEAERLYKVLSDGGEIFMKMEKAAWANRFAMLRDKFGTSWMLLQRPMEP